MTNTLTVSYLGHSVDDYACTLQPGVVVVGIPDTFQTPSVTSSSSAAARICSSVLSLGKSLGDFHADVSGDHHWFRVAYTPTTLDKLEAVAKIMASVGSGPDVLAAVKAHAVNDGHDEYTDRAGEVAAGQQSAEWAWPLLNADKAYIDAVGTDTICKELGLGEEAWEGIGGTWCEAFLQGYKAAHATATYDAMTRLTEDGCQVTLDQNHDGYHVLARKYDYAGQIAMQASTTSTDLHAALENVCRRMGCARVMP